VKTSTCCVCAHVHFGWCGWARACVECRVANDGATAFEGITTICPAESIGDMRHDPADFASAVRELRRKRLLQIVKQTHFKTAYDVLRSKRLRQLSDKAERRGVADSSSENSSRKPAPNTRMLQIDLPSMARVMKPIDSNSPRRFCAGERARAGADDTAASCS
jgi:hypothetical protein